MKVQVLLSAFLISENCMSLLAHAVFELIHPQLQSGELIDIDSTDVRRLLSVFFNFAIAILLA
ncbi:hypothetical protein [Nostoc sp.]|uniref:hypothetical protein n=1 Tax=Nostoc sp. TaxID=1180 RepID=UPI002FFC347E